MPQPTPIAVIRSEIIARCAAGGRGLVSPQLTIPGRLQARMLISTMIAAVNGTVYFSKVLMA